MIEAKNWQKQDFLKFANCEKLSVLANDCWFFDEEKDAFAIYKNILRDKIEFLFRLDDKQLANNYKQILFKVVYIALPRLATEEVANWFRNNLLEFLLLEEEILLKEKIRKHLAQTVISERDGLKKILIKAMEANGQLIGSQQINNSIGDWLKDYRLFLADRKNDRKLTQVEYLLRRVDIVGVKGKEIIVKLLNLYDFLHLSSFSVEGNEDPQLLSDEDGYYGLYKGEIFKINFSGASPNENKFYKEEITNKEIIVKDNNAVGLLSKEKMEARLMTSFRNFYNGQTMVQIERIKREIGQSGDSKTLRNHFYQAVNGGKTEEAVAALLLLAEMGKLGEAFGGDERFVKFWGDYLAKNPPAGGPGVAGEFIKNPANERDLARFLQYILEGRLKMKSEEAVMTGVLIANLARLAGETVYKTLAYGEMESGEFRWNV